MLIYLNPAQCDACGLPYAPPQTQPIPIAPYALIERAKVDPRKLPSADRLLALNNGFGQYALQPAQ